MGEGSGLADTSLGGGSGDAWKLKLLVQAVFYAGQASLSGFHTLLDRYTETIRMYADTIETQTVRIIPFIFALFSSYFPSFFALFVPPL